MANMRSWWQSTSPTRGCTPSSGEGRRTIPSSGWCHAPNVAKLVPIIARLVPGVSFSGGTHTSSGHCALHSLKQRPHTCLLPGSGLGRHRAHPSRRDCLSPDPSQPAAAICVEPCLSHLPHTCLPPPSHPSRHVYLSPDLSQPATAICVETCLSLLNLPNLLSLVGPNITWNGAATSCFLGWLENTNKILTYINWPDSVSGSDVGLFNAAWFSQ